MQATKTALITGIAGQDGAYLAQLLLDKGYAVTGTHRRAGPGHFWRLEELGIRAAARLTLVEHDLADPAACVGLLRSADFDEVYNLAAQSCVGAALAQPLTMAGASGVGALHLLEAIRVVNPRIRFYQASSSEMFGRAEAVPQVEETPFHPRSPYGVAKLHAHWISVTYRECYGIFSVSGILFNHESPLRGPEFVTRKITDAVARIALGEAEVLELGNLDARRDWGYAKEYVEGMWRMLQADQPGTFVLATNRTTTVREFATLAFRAVDTGLEWQGRDGQECGHCSRSGKLLVRVNPAYCRPGPQDVLVGNADKARAQLGWAPDTRVEQLCAMMVAADLRRRQLRAAA